MIGDLQEFTAIDRAKSGSEQVEDFLHRALSKRCLVAPQFALIVQRLIEVAPQSWLNGLQFLEPKR